MHSKGARVDGLLEEEGELSRKVVLANPPSTAFR